MNSIIFEPAGSGKSAFLEKMMAEYFKFTEESTSNTKWNTVGLDEIYVVNDTKPLHIWDDINSKIAVRLQQFGVVIASAYQSFEHLRYELINFASSIKRGFNKNIKENSHVNMSIDMKCDYSMCMDNHFRNSEDPSITFQQRISDSSDISTQ